MTKQTTTVVIGRLRVKSRVEKILYAKVQADLNLHIMYLSQVTFLFGTAQMTCYVLFSEGKKKITGKQEGYDGPVTLT